MAYDEFNDMDDLFRQLMNGMGGFNSENRRYLINGRQVTPEEFAEYQKTGQLPGQKTAAPAKGQKANGILENWAAT